MLTLAPGVPSTGGSLACVTAGSTLFHRFGIAFAFGIGSGTVITTDVDGSELGTMVTLSASSSTILSSGICTELW